MRSLTYQILEFDITLVSLQEVQIKKIFPDVETDIFEQVAIISEIEANAVMKIHHFHYTQSKELVSHMSSAHGAIFVHSENSDTDFEELTNFMDNRQKLLEKTEVMIISIVDDDKSTIDRTSKKDELMKSFLFRSIRPDSKDMYWAMREFGSRLIQKKRDL